MRNLPSPAAVRRSSKRRRLTEESRKASRFAPFDGLRAVAVLLVFACHQVYWAFPGGWVGVELFFVLSGFLITSLLLREWERTGRIDLRAFYLRRFFRLAPALVMFVAVAAPAAWLLGDDRAFTEGLAAVTYTMDIYLPLHDSADSFLSHTWSLAVEEQFYLVWPAFLLLALSRGCGVGRVITSLAAVSAVGGGIIAWAWGPLMGYSNPFPHLPIILSGAGLALAVHYGGSWTGRLASGWVPVLAGVIATAVWCFVGIERVWLYWGVLLAVSAPLVALVGHLVARPEGPAARFLTLSPLVWLGERSYGFYLWHIPPVYFLRNLNPRQYVGAPVAFGAALVLTVLSWVLVERPFLRLKCRFAR